MDFKKMIMDLKNMDDKKKGMVKIGLILGGIFFGFILIFIIYKIIFGNVLAFDKIENIMVKSAKTYVKNHPEKVEGNISGTTEIKVSDLIAEGYMKDMSKYTKKDVMCSGSVLVFKNIDDYSYSPKLDCGDAYKYKLLTDEITKKENIVTKDTGLYKVETEEPYYVFRGENVDNYVSIGDNLWRIIRIDNDGNIRLFQDSANQKVVWDNRYNIDKSFKSGINDFEGVQASRIKDEIISLYNNEEMFSKSFKSIIVPKEFCIGKRSAEDIDNTGAIECSVKSELMGAGTIALYEYLQASIDPNCFNSMTESCNNYNYLATYKKAYWTLTASSTSSSGAFQIGRKVTSARAASFGATHLVITVNGNINYTKGTGTKEDPYIIKPIV